MPDEMAPPEVQIEHEGLASLRQALPGAMVRDGLDLGGDAYGEIRTAWLVPALQYCKEKLGFDRLVVTCVDFYPAEPRFEMIYELHRVPKTLAEVGKPQRLRLKARTSADGPIDSAYAVYRSADWYEREIYDLFGVKFQNHPNLQRILMPEEWDGHPLRKDYPIHGFKYSYKDE